MFVIHPTRKGFIHIPRTAGRFIESQCRLVEGFESIRPHHTHIPENFMDYEWHTRPQTDFITPHVRWWTDVSDCVKSLGGTVTGAPINQSHYPRPTLTKEQVIKVKSIYQSDVDLWNGLCYNV